MFVTPAFFLLLFQIPILKKDIGLLAGLNTLDQEKDIHSSFDDSTDAYFPTNPMELMNVLKSIESMTDRTSPTDAIDEALKAFENEDQLDSSFNAGNN
ncbi:MULTISPECIES: hypothetical protein [unclassified Prochlorococcus]|uniref:hypothetical protein n=1 Tax=unclassified Prochlorococcus TaxID=2627481 RepID=UPI0005339085|nr:MULTISPECIES: hypothetical protein [unclassified Prochlorococcus]KGG16474.1 hypothetical protein EV06_0312 [Prochlorococcus sp. MIT 0602]KGG17051.1 hypothetical protein EV07_0481 [Prochlorococcus sp. MIT 0603]